ncbi:MAG TPA: 30S ribosomal protein S18 [Deinococcales bacterium]|nr:30S ribosomal protein S18 [Deinococcales bacterium]
MTSPRNSGSSGGSGGSGSGETRRPRGKGPKRPRKPKVDPFKTGELEVTDYHDAKMLRRFISDTGKILPRRRTGVNAKNQRRLALTIKRARMLALLPYTEKLVRR